MTNDRGEDHAGREREMCTAAPAVTVVNYQRMS